MRTPTTTTRLVDDRASLAVKFRKKVYQGEIVGQWLVLRRRQNGVSYTKYKPDLHGIRNPENLENLYLGPLGTQDQTREDFT